MVDMGCESLSTDLAADGARAMPDQALRDLGRSLCARVETVVQIGVGDILMEKRSRDKCLREPRANYRVHI
eukprot:5203556-Pyramimonas_sp.AAC.1